MAAENEIERVVKKQEKTKMDLKRYLHCTENPIYLFPEMKLCGLIPNCYIHVPGNI
jgi:hypothetical protein